MSESPLRAPLRHPDVLGVGLRIALDATTVAGLRLREIRVKEAFTLVDREGRFFRASLTEMGPRSGSAQVYELMPTSPESPARITLYCAVLGRQRMLAVIQKATELGVMGVVPVLSERSVQADGLDHEKAHAWPAQALRACRQCRRASVPEVRPAIPFAEMLSDPALARVERRVHLDDRTERRFTRLDPGTRAPSSIALCVGPEGGFTDAECAALEAHGFVGMRVGGRVLRAETAVLGGLTLLQEVYGDMNVDP